jgi:CRISPR/Cas system-associated exonuclease Cas4 (RecB family)
MPISEPTTNDYTKILDYLDSLDTTTTKKKEEVKQPLPEKHKSSSTLVLEEEEKVRKSTREIIQKSKTKEGKELPGKKSSGFDVKKFESLLRTKLIDEYKKLQSYERPYISVSEIVACIRKAYYYRLKFSVDVKDLFKFPYIGLIQEVGNSIHSYVQTTYDFTEVNKTLVSDKFGVKGKTDASKDNYLYELKTVDEDKVPSEPLSYHYDQGLIYAYIMNTEYGYNIDTITVVYIVRSNLRKIVPFDVPMNEERAKSLLERGVTLRNHLVKNTTPEPLGATIDQCNFCEFKKFCEKDPSEVTKPYDFSKFEKEIDKVDLSKSVFLL